MQFKIVAVMFGFMCERLALDVKQSKPLAIVFDLPFVFFSVLLLIAATRVLLFVMT